jgi:hypothetical protein
MDYIYMTPQGRPAHYPLIPIPSLLSTHTHIMSNQAPVASTIDAKGVGDKPHPDYKEEIEEKDHVQDNTVQLVSADKYLSLWQTIKTYPRASFFSALAAFGAVSDGYQYNLPGNIIALPGFVRQFGYDSGPPRGWMINPQHISLWSGEYAAGK